MALFRSPAERYIKALILHPAEYSNEKIVKKLDRLELDPIGPDYIKELREGLKPPPAFYPEDGRHHPTVKFLRQQEVYSFFHPDLEAQAAWTLLTTPSAKLHIEALSLSGLPEVTITAALRREGRLIPDGAVSAYLYGYWDLTMFDVVQIRALLHMRIDGACRRSSSPEVAAQAAALKKASYLDPRISAASLPNNELNARLIGHRLGLPIGNLSFSKAAQEIIGASTLQTYEAVCRGGQQGATEASLLAGVVQTFKKLLADDIDVTAVITKQLDSVRLKQETKAVPMIAELTQGNHTADTAVIDPDHKEK